MNLHVLFLGQPHDSCLFVWHFHLMEVSGVCYDGLDAYLVMYILHEFKTGCVSQSGYLALISWCSYVEILHMDSANCVINSGIPFESNIHSIVVRGRLTHSLATTRSVFWWIPCPPDLAYRETRRSAPMCTLTPWICQTLPCLGSVACTEDPGCHWEGVCDHLEQPPSNPAMQLR